MVVKPPASIETRVVFASPLLRRDTAVILPGFAEGGGGRYADPAFGSNDLQEAAEAASPQVAQAAEWLSQRFGNSRMTGSGSAVFAHVDSDMVAGVSSSLSELPSGWVGRCCRSLEHHPLVGWASDGEGR